MSISSINMEAIVSNAYYCKKNYSYEQYINQTVEFLYQGFYNFDMFGDKVLNKYKGVSAYPAFTIVHNYITLFIYDDGNLYRNEYDAYCKFCEKCGHKFFSVNELLEHRKKLNASDVRGLTSFLILLRDCVSSSYFQNFIYGMVMLSLLDTGELQESAYCGLQYVLKQGFDNAPPYYELMSKVYKW